MNRSRKQRTLCWASTPSGSAEFNKNQTLLCFCLYQLNLTVFEPHSNYVNTWFMKLFSPVIVMRTKVLWMIGRLCPATHQDLLLSPPFQPYQCGTLYDRTLIITQKDKWGMRVCFLIRLRLNFCSFLSKHCWICLLTKSTETKRSGLWAV